MLTKPWEETATATLNASLSPLSHEKNELDWKLALSENTEKLVHHSSAYANQPGGGCMVFGVGDDAAVELAQLPPLELIETENHTKVLLYAPPPL